jgi:hypothetical protein
MTHPESVDSLSDDAKVLVTIEVDATVSYASYQNNVPLLRTLSLANTTEEPLSGIEIGIHCEPDLADPMRLQFERLEPKETRRISPLDLHFRHRHLAEMNEAERGRIVVRVKSEGREIGSTSHPVDLLAYDQL